MNLLYINVGGSTKVTSVYKKIFGQINALQNLGVNCQGVFLSTHVKNEQKVHECVTLTPVERPSVNLFYQLKLQKTYTKKIIDLIKNSPVDVIYMRHSFCNRALLRAIQKTKKLVVVERNAKAIPELRNMQKAIPFAFKVSNLLSKIQNYYIPVLQEKLYANKINKAVTAVVCVTKELSHYYGKSAKKSITISNGIATKEYAIRLPVKDEKFVILILDGTSVAAGWHGTERLIESIKKHHLENKVEVRIAGSISEVIEDSFVKQLGFLNNNQLEEEFNIADIGTGNLCLFKKGLKEASVLKNREYLTRGLPVLYAFDDLDIDTTAFKKYCYKIPNDSSIIDLPNLIAWRRDLQVTSPNHAEEMNKLAIQLLDFKVKLAPLVQFLEKKC